MPRLILNGEVANVKPEAVQKYLDRGARYAPPEDQPIEANPLLDPLNFLPTARLGELGLAGAQAIPGAARAAGSAIGSAAGRVGPALARGAGGAALETGLEFLPFGPAGRVIARGLLSALRGGGGRVAQGAGQEAVQAAEGAAPGLAERVAANYDLGPIVGRAEAAAYRSGGPEAVMQVRAAKQAAQEAAQAATPAPSPVSESFAPRPLAPPKPPTGMSRIRSLKPLRANASPEARRNLLADFEEAAQEAKLPAAARQRFREELGLVKPKVAGEIKPAPRGSAASRVEGKVVGEIKPSASGSAEARVATKGGQELEGKAADDWLKQVNARRPASEQRTVRYYSSSTVDPKTGIRGTKIDIETMHPAHLRSAINKDQRELAKFGAAAAKRAPVKYKELQELLAEQRFRMTMGEHSVY